MGMPDYQQQIQYPNAQQTPAQYKQIVSVGSVLGWGIVFWIFILGAFVAVVIIFKKRVKAILGDGIKFLERFINK